MTGYSETRPDFRLLASTPYPTPMTCRDSLKYLAGLKSRGINLDLGPVSRLLHRFDNPHKRYKTILVGGSNGKGSVAATIASILRRTGARVGLYTSPHLIDFKERIRINNDMIPEEELSGLIDWVRASVTENVTYFEFATVLAFLHFYACNVDIAVLEVGMGGRLDATNVVVPEVSVITNISLEHQKYLGKRLELIAREKGGIIKKGRACITAAEQSRVLTVLEDISSRLGSSFYRVGKDIRMRRAKDGSISYYGIMNNYSGLVIPLIGKHQIENTAVALGAVELLKTRGFDVGDDAVLQGLRDVRWEGRLEMLNDTPQLLVDGAHNSAGVSTLCRALTDDFTYDRLILVFGVLKDKDYRGMLRKLAPRADEIILTRPKEARAIEMDILLETAKRYNENVIVIPDSRKALQGAFDRAGTRDLICVAGSLYLVGEIKKAFSFLSF